MSDSAPDSGPTAAAVLAARLSGEGNVDAGDVAPLIERMDSREMLLDDNLFESLPVDELIRKSDPAHIDRMFLGHMKQELWKSVLPEGQQPEQEQPDENLNQQPQREQVPTTPSTVASTITSWRGRIRTRLRPKMKGRGAAIKKPAKQANKKSHTGNTSTGQTSKIKVEGCKDVKEEREAPGVSSSAEVDAEPRQPSSSKGFSGELSFVVGSGAPLASKNAFQKEGKTNDVDVVPSESISNNKADAATKDVQTIVSAVEAQFTEKFRAIESTLQSLRLKQRKSLAANEEKPSPRAAIHDGQLSPQRLQTITAAMEHHFAPRFGAIESSLSSIQHTLAVLTTSLAQNQPPQPQLCQQLTPVTPQQQQWQHLSQSVILSPVKARGTDTRSLLGCNVRVGDVAKLCGEGHKKGDQLEQQRGISAVTRNKRDQSNVIDRITSPVQSHPEVNFTPVEVVTQTPKWVSPLQDVGFSPIQHCSAAANTKIGKAGAGFACGDELRMNIAATSPTRNPVKSPDQRAKNQGSTIKADDKMKEAGESKKGNTKIISRAKKILSKTNRTSPSTPEAPSHSFIQKKYTKKTAGKDHLAESKDPWKEDTREMDTSHPFSNLSLGADLLRERIQSSIETKHRIDSHEVAEVPTVSTMRIKRLQYRSRTPFEEDPEDPSLPYDHQSGAGMKDDKAKHGLRHRDTTVRNTSAAKQCSIKWQKEVATPRPTVVDSMSRIPNEEPGRCSEEPTLCGVKPAEPSSKKERQNKLGDTNAVQSKGICPFSASSRLEGRPQTNHHMGTLTSPGRSVKKLDNSETFVAAQQTKKQRSSTVAPHHFEELLKSGRKAEEEPQGLKRKPHMALHENLSSWIKDIITPLSLPERAHEQDQCNHSLLLAADDIPASIKPVEEHRMIPDDSDVTEGTPAILESKLWHVTEGKGPNGSSQIQQSKVNARNTSPKEPPAPPEELAMEQKIVSEEENLKIVLSSSSHPSDEEDELMACELYQLPNQEPHQEQQCCKDLSIDECEEIIGVDEVKKEEGVAAYTSADSIASSKSCLTDELGPIGSYPKLKAAALSIKLSQSASQEGKIPLNDGSPKPQLHTICTDEEESFSDISGLSPTVQSLPEYLDSPQPFQYTSFSFPMPSSRSRNYMQVIHSIDDEEVEVFECTEDNGVRSYQEFASPPNSILATSSSSRRQVIPSNRNSNENSKPTEGSQAKKSTAHPNEIVVLPEEHLLTPGVSTVSHSISTVQQTPRGTQDLASLGVNQISSDSPTNVDCCSPNTLHDHFFQGEKTLEALIRKRNGKKRLQKAEGQAAAGSIVWSNPSHALTNAHDSEGAKLMLPNLDVLPQNNSAFAIIAQKIAEAEAALKAELARENHIDFPEEDECSTGDEKTNMEIFIPNSPYRTLDTPVRIVRPRSPGPTTTILTDSADRYIELVHMNSASLLDQPVSPAASAKSAASSNASEIEMSSKKVKNKGSFLERFQARNDQKKQNGNRHNERSTAQKKDKKQLPPAKVQQQEEQQQQKKLSKLEEKERHEVPSAFSNCSSYSNAVRENDILGIGVDLMDGQLHQNENTDQDAAQIFEIVERYYHYHHRYQAGNPEHFTVSLEERKKDPLDQLLTWTMVAFEAIEKDFLTSFHDPALEDGDFDKEDNDDDEAMHDVNEETDEVEIGDDKSKRKLASMDPLERLGIFDIDDSSSDSSSSFEDDENDTTLFTDDEDSIDNKSITSGVYDRRRRLV